MLNLLQRVDPSYSRASIIHLFFLIIKHENKVCFLHEDQWIPGLSLFLTNSGGKLLMCWYEVCPPVWNSCVFLQFLLRSSKQCGCGLYPPRPLLLPLKPLPLWGGESGCWGGADGRPHLDLSSLLHLRPPLSPMHLLLFLNTPALLAAAPPARRNAGDNFICIFKRKTKISSIKTCFRMKGVPNDNVMHPCSSPKFHPFLLVRIVMWTFPF